MKGFIIELNEDFGYIRGIDGNDYLFKRELKYQNFSMNDTVLFRGEKIKVKENYYIYKASQIIKNNN